MATKLADALTLKDRLSRLTFVEACKLLGEGGAKLIRQGAKLEIDPANVELNDFLLRVSLANATVTICLSKAARQRLEWHCTACHENCEHVGAAFSLVLEDKSLLGLAEAPTDDTPLELLTEAQLVERMLAERQKRAAEEKMTIKPLTPDVLW